MIIKSKCDLCGSDIVNGKCSFCGKSYLKEKAAENQRYYDKETELSFDEVTRTDMILEKIIKVFDDSILKRKPSDDGKHQTEIVTKRGSAKQSNVYDRNRRSIHKEDKSSDKIFSTLKLLPILLMFLAVLGIFSFVSSKGIRKDNNMDNEVDVVTEMKSYSYTVNYAGVNAGKEYTLVCSLVDKDGEVIIVNGEALEVVHTFTPDAEDGQFPCLFEIPEDLNEDEFRVLRELYEGDRPDEERLVARSAL